MDIANRLASIQQEIQTVENEKLQCEQMLGLFWEHPPALDPEVVGRRMQLYGPHSRSETQDFFSPEGAGRPNNTGCHPRSPGRLE
uniref:Uncharacterized protein n=1 Tax=Brassica campestris TaxID=3711 RepID=A0A3P6DS67_BRACM|nr:unnamed protein product [Brassica rapa]